MTVEIPILDVCTFSISGPNMNMIRTTQRVFKRYPKTSMHGWYVIAFAHFFSSTWGCKQCGLRAAELWCLAPGY